MPYNPQVDAGYPFLTIKNPGSSTETEIIRIGRFSSHPEADYWSIDSSATASDIYTFRNGGASGSVVQTVIIYYTSSAKTAASAASAYNA